MKIWSWRYSFAYGWDWKYERDVTPDTAQAWLSKFQSDEPKIDFKLSDKRPRKKRA